MADDLHKLLLYIVDNVILADETRESEIDATAVRDVAGEISAVAQDSRSDAERLAPFFSMGMHRVQGGRLVVDDTTPEGNNIADAFARFLVTPDLASSETTDLGNEHYRYTFDLNMPALNDLARRAGVDLGTLGPG